jgi:hypothetical protein
VDQRVELSPQLLAIGACLAYATVVTFALLKLVDKIVGLRLPEDAEREGLDATLHGEEAYATTPFGGHIVREAERPPDEGDVRTPAPAAAEAGGE